MLLSVPLLGFWRQTLERLSHVCQNLFGGAAAGPPRPAGPWQGPCLEILRIRLGLQLVSGERAGARVSFLHLSQERRRGSRGPQ